MAEEENGTFDDTLEKLGDATKKPAAGKAKTVMAVQVVDKGGKPAAAGGGGDGETPAEKKKAAVAEGKTDKKQSGLLGKIAGGMSTVAKKIMEPVKKAKGSVMDMIKGAAIAAALMAVLAFFNSKYWTQTKDFLVEEIVPALKKLWNDYLKPIGVIFKDYILKAWENIKELFSGLSESFDLFAEGKWWEGIKKFFGSIGTFLGKALDNAITAIYNIIASVFGWEQTGSVFGSISKAFWDVWDWVTSAIDNAWKSLKSTISNVFDGIVNWFKLVFTDPVAALKKLVKGLFGAYLDVTSWLVDMIKKPIVWLLGLFGWDTAAAALEEFSLKTFVLDAFATIKTWITDLFKWGKKTGTDASGKWSLKTFITEIWGKVKTWFTDLWKWGKKDGEGDFNLSTFVDTAFAKAWKWVKSLFVWGTEPVTEKDSWIKKIVHAAIKAVKKWATSLFTWAETPGGSWISKTVKDAIKLVKAWALSLFSWASTAGQVEGKEWSLSKLVDAAVLKIIGWVKSLFAWATSDEATDPADFSIKGMIKKVLKTIIGWVTGLWAWAKSKDEVTDPAGFSISGMIKKVIRTIVGWVTGLFTWASKAGHMKDKDGKDQPWSFMKMLGAVVTKIIGWVKGLFSWGVKAGHAKDKDGKEKPWSLMTLIGAAIDKVIGWVTGLFSWGSKDGHKKDKDGKDTKWSFMTLISTVIDKVVDWIGDIFTWNEKMGAKLKAILPSWMTDPIGALKGLISGLTKYLPSWLGGGGNGEEAKGTTESPIDREIKKRDAAAKARQAEIDKLGADINKQEKAGRKWKFKDPEIIKIQKLIKENEKALKADAEFKKAALTKSKNSSIFTHDQGLHDRLDRIIKVQDQRASVMKQFKLDAAADGAGGAGGSVTIAAPSAVNASTNSSVHLGQLPTTDTKLSNLVATIP